MPKQLFFLRMFVKKITNIPAEPNLLRRENVHTVIFYKMSAEITDIFVDFSEEML